MTTTTSLQLAGDNVAMEMLLDPVRFEHMQRVAGLFAGSALVPEHLKLPDVFIGLQIALRTGQDPLTVLQSMYVVGGKPGWSATYLIAQANRSGAFSGPLDWEMAGVAWKGDQPGDLTVTCYADLVSGKQVRATASMAMAKAEGWLRNPKYRSMPEQMLRYRSATMLVRLYCPEIMLGLPDQYELQDIAASESVPPPRVVVDVVDAEPPEQKGMAALDEVLAADPEPPPLELTAPEPAADDKAELLALVADAEQELQAVGPDNALRQVREETGRLKGVDQRCGEATIRTYLDALGRAIDAATQGV